MELHVAEIESPLGTLLLAARGGRLCALEFADHRMRMHEIFAARFRELRLKPEATEQDARLARDVGARLGAYFAGDLDALSEIAVDPGGTQFQQRVWMELRRIPPGTTCSYAELASRIGKPKAMRAVGLANSKNPVAVIIPCHRVVGADGSLTGYAGGIDRKRWLLNHELEWSRVATS
jgi:methylated-DNA-[protein]-cysteine S-methyltransferase